MKNTKLILLILISLLLFNCSKNDGNQENESLSNKKIVITYDKLWPKQNHREIGSPIKKIEGDFIFDMSGIYFAGYVKYIVENKERVTNEKGSIQIKLNDIEFEKLKKVYSQLDRYDLLNKKEITVKSLKNEEYKFYVTKSIHDKCWKILPSDLEKNNQKIVIKASIKPIEIKESENNCILWVSENIEVLTQSGKPIVRK